MLEVVDGSVVRILRSVPSSLVKPGERVLSDARLEELGALLWHLDKFFPVDTSVYSRDDVLLDIEFKIDAKDDLAIKQIRPFLITSPEPDDPTFELEIPTGAVACGLFSIGRNVREEYEAKSVVHFIGDTFRLPGGLESFTETIVGEIEMGPERIIAVSSGPGLFTTQKKRLSQGEIEYNFDYTQEFTLPGGEIISLEMSSLTFQTRDRVPIESKMELDSELLTDRVSLIGSFKQGDTFVNLSYSSCTHDSLPLWELEVTIEDGTSVLLEERSRTSPDADFGPASLVAARVVIAGETRTVSGYWNLVYSALKHNTHETYWVLLDPPVMAPGIIKPVHVVEVRAPVPLERIPESANYRGENFEMLAALEISSYSKEPIDLGENRKFRRGDVNADATIALNDASMLLHYLFRRGQEPTCRKAADANDDGLLNVGDALAILHHLFIEPQLFGSCAIDPTADGLACRVYESCE